MLLKLRNLIKKYPYITVALLISLVFIFTPYYTVGYIGILIISSLYLRPLKSFDSYFSNFIIAALLLCVSIMIAGIFAILLHIPDHALLNALVYSGVIIPMLAYQPKRDRMPVIFSKIDVVAIIIALAGPVLISVIQLSGNPPHVAIYKIADGNGWDSSPHLGLLQLNERFNGYVYPSAHREHNGNKVFNAYPQGWHLASSNLANGFGAVAFDSAKTSVPHILVMYVLIIFAWYAVTMYVFVRIVASLARKAIDQLGVVSSLIALSAVALLPTLTVMLPSIYHGFVNYVAIIPFLLLVIAMVVQYLNDPVGNRRVLSYASSTAPLLAGITLLWTLPIPGLVLVCLYTLTINKDGLTLLKSFSKIPMILCTLVIGIPTIVYAYILMTNIGFDQVYINTGYVAGFPRPELALILVAILIIGIHGKYLDISFKRMLIIVAPLTLYMFILWIFSYVKSDLIGYYQAKMFTLIITIIIAFVSAIIINVSTKISKDRLSTLTLFMTTTCIVSGIIILSNNPLLLNSLKRPVRDNGELVGYAIDWAYATSPNSHDKLLIFDDNLDEINNKAMLHNVINIDTSLGRYGDYNEAKVQEDASNCVSTAMFYIGVTGRYTQPEMLQRLSTCLKARSEAGYETMILSKRSNKPIFDNIKTYNANFTYI